MPASRLRWVKLAAALNGLLVAALLAVLVYTLPRSVAYRRVLDENLQLKERLDDIDEKMNEVDRMLLRLRLYDSQLESLAPPKGDHGPVDLLPIVDTEATDAPPLEELTMVPGPPAGIAVDAPPDAADPTSDALPPDVMEIPAESSGLRSAESWAAAISDRLDTFIERMNRSEPTLTDLVVALEDLRALELALPKQWPSRGQLTSKYGWRRNPFGYRGYRFHSGLDIAGPRGTPIYAAADGLIARAEFNSGYGRMVEIDHGFGITTIYAHCNSLLVKAGDRVVAGRQIGTMGSTGQSTGPHLHFEVRLDGNAVDPMDYLPRTRTR